MIAAVPLLNTVLAPDPGALNVTWAFGTGFEFASRTTAMSANPKLVFTLAFCPDPETTAMLVAPADVTMSPVWIPVIDEVAVSVAESDQVPTVRNVALKVWTPRSPAAKR